MTNAYTCNILRRLLAECFDYAMSVLQFPPEKFIDVFISSPIVKEIESENPKYCCGIAGSELCEIILSIAKIPFSPKLYTSFERSKYYWVGDYLGAYKYYKNYSFKYIFSFVSISTLLNMYPIYHEMDTTNFFEELDRLNKETPSRLSILRKKAQLSQTQLSSLADIPLKTIQAYEQKLKDINKAEVQALLRISRILNCSITELLEQ